MIALLLAIHARMLAHPALLRRRSKLLMHKATRLEHGAPLEWVSAQIDACNLEVERRRHPFNGRIGDVRVTGRGPKGVN